jgi:hypothetical protein
MAGGDGVLAGLGRNRPSRLGFDRGLHGKDLGLARRRPERGARRRRAVWQLRRGIACGKAGEKGKRAGDAPYCNAELLGHLCDGGKQWSGGAAGGRDAAVKATALLGFTSRGGGCGICGTLGAGRRLYRAAEGASTCGRGMPRELEDGDDPDRQAPPVSEREKGEGS